MNESNWSNQREIKKKKNTQVKSLAISWCFFLDFFLEKYKKKHHKNGLWNDPKNADELPTKKGIHTN